MTPEEQIAQVLSGWFAEHLTYETFRTTSDGDLAAGAAEVLVAAGIGPTAEAQAEALTDAADDSEDHCRLHHVDQPPCTCFSVTKNLRNRAAILRGAGR